MGIAGLIPFLEKASSSVNVKQFEGSSVTVDSYCWLHKGVFACAEKLIRGETTDLHIQYCLKYVDMLLRHKIKVIMVFDGRHLPAKAETERKRREARNESKQLAKEYLRRNEVEKAKSHMRRAVDVTHEMALALIKACRKRDVDCIVAPYEADAQMAWLNIKGLAEYVVTEDSDLTLFGAKKILFKLDLSGQALLVENTKLYLAMGCKPEKYTFDKFRRMCILSGCDYLDSLQGIGLRKACKFVLTTEQDDMKQALKKIPSYLKMKQLEVTNEYTESFLKAEATFKHMYIYNPLERKMERLHEIDVLETEECHCSNAGSLLNSAEQAFQLALGNLNPFTLEKVDDWHPNQMKSKYKSIWHTARDLQAFDKLSESEHLKKTTSSILDFKKIVFKNNVEMEIEEKLSEEKSKLEECEIFTLYNEALPKVDQKRKRQQSISSCEDEEVKKNKDLSRTPKKCSHNPFSKVNNSFENINKSPVCINNSLLKLLSPKKNNEENYNKKTLPSKMISVKSRFFTENVKHVEKKNFAARDLTSEMFKIEEKTNTCMEQQKDLYFCSLQSPKKKNVEKEQNTLDLLLIDNSKHCNGADKIKYNKEASASGIDSANSFQYFPVAKGENIISDVEDEQCSQEDSPLSSVKNFTSSTHQPKSIISKTKIKPQSTPLKYANNLGNFHTKQSKLSMFGFQKRPSLKKL